MIGQAAGPKPATPPTRFSEDSFWWWDGAEWKAAISPDGLWRWSGQAWVPAHMAPPKAAGGGGRTIGVTTGIFAGVVLVISLVVVVLVLTMGDSFTNIFSNVTAALG